MNSSGLEWGLMVGSYERCNELRILIIRRVFSLAWQILGYHEGLRSKELAVV